MAVYPCSEGGDSDSIKLKSHKFETRPIHLYCKGNLYV